MSVWSELAETNKLVRAAEATSGYFPERRFSIRERAINKMALAAGKPGWRLQGASELADRQLSPELRELTSQRLALRQGALGEYRRQLVAIRRQDEIADADDRAFAKATPLQQARKRDGWYRLSDLDRAAAIAGLLRRERRASAPLTREAQGRAKSIDAARGKRIAQHDVFFKGVYLGRRTNVLHGDPYVVSDADLERAAGGPLTSLDLRDYELTQKRRRETMFAGDSVKHGGYPGKRGPSFKSQLREVSCGPD